MVVDEAGNDRPAAQVDATRASPGKTVDLLIRADRDDLVAANRNRLSDREPLVDGDDLAVRQNQIRCALGGEDGNAPAVSTPASAAMVPRVMRAPLSRG